MIAPLLWLSGCWASQDLAHTQTPPSIVRLGDALEVEISIAPSAPLADARLDLWGIDPRERPLPDFGLEDQPLSWGETFAWAPELPPELESVLLRVRAPGLWAEEVRLHRRQFGDELEAHDPEPVSIELVPRETLWVRLVDETGAPPQGDGRALTEFRRPAERQLLRAPNRPLLRALAWGPWVSAGGRLVLVDPPPWTTDVRVDLGGVGAALALSFDPTPRPAGEELVLEVSSGLTVRGRLRRADGQPLPAFRWGDRAAVHRVQGNTELLGCTGQAVELAPDGSFEFRGLAPGDHYVGVFLGAQQRVELWSLPRPEGAELAFEFDGHELLLEVDPAHGAPALGSLRILATGDLRRHDLLGRIDERVELGEERAPLRLWVPRSDAPLAVIATALDGQLFGPSPAARPDPDRVLLVPIALGSVRFELPDLVPGSFARFHPQLIPLGAGATAWVGSCDLDRFGRAEATGVTPGRYLVYGSLTDGGQMVLLPPYAEITVGARETAETSVRTVRGGRLEVRLEPAAADGFVPEQLEGRVEIEPEGARSSLPFGPLFLPGTYRSHRPALQRSGLLAPGLRRMELLGRTGHEVRSLWTEVAIESDRVSTIVLRFEP